MTVTLRRLLNGITATIRNPNAHSPPLPPIPYHHVHRHLSFPFSLPSLYLNHRLFSSSPTGNLIPTKPAPNPNPARKTIRDMGSEAQTRVQGTRSERSTESPIGPRSRPRHFLVDLQAAELQA
ncbi:hypothetical protein ACFX13_036199 [Malus domestica]